MTNSRTTSHVLVKIIDFITNLIRSCGAARCSSIITDCTDYNRVYERYSISHILFFGTAAKTTRQEIWQCRETVRNPAGNIK